MKKLIRQFKQYLASVNGVNYHAKTFLYERGMLPSEDSPFFSARRNYRFSMGMA